MPFRLFNQNVTKTKIDYEGIDFSAFTHLLRKDRDFTVDMVIRMNISKVRLKEGSRAL